VKGKLHVITEDVDMGVAEPGTTWLENIEAITLAGVNARLRAQVEFERFLCLRDEAMSGLGPVSPSESRHVLADPLPEPADGLPGR